MNEPWVYIIIIGLVIIVYSRIQPQRASVVKGSAQITEEVEASMEQVTIIMEEERKELLAYMANAKTETEQAQRVLQAKLDMLERQYGELSSQLALLDQHSHAVAARMDVLAHASVSGVKGAMPLTTGSAQLAAEPSELAISDDNNSLLDLKRRYAELFILHDEGKSAETIARKLRMNKAEVSLILQLARQEADHA